MWEAPPRTGAPVSRLLKRNFTLTWTRHLPALRDMHSSEDRMAVHLPGAAPLLSWEVSAPLGVLRLLAALVFATRVRHSAVPRRRSRNRRRNEVAVVRDGDSHAPVTPS